MKNILIVILIVALVAIVMSSCSFYTCATYAKAPHNKVEKKDIRL